MPIEAANADEALQVLNRSAEAVAILHYNMPGRNGLELAEELLDRMGEAHGWRSPEAMEAAAFLQRLARPDRSPWFVAKMAEAVLNFYAELEHHPGEPRHPRVRSAVRRLDRLEEMGLQNLVELPGDAEASGIALVQDEVSDEGHHPDQADR